MIMGDESQQLDCIKKLDALSGVVKSIYEKVERIDPEQQRLAKVAEFQDRLLSISKGYGVIAGILSIALPLVAALFVKLAVCPPGWWPWPVRYPVSCDSGVDLCMVFPWSSMIWASATVLVISLLCIAAILAAGFVALARMRSE